MNELNGSEVCEALSNPVRVCILQELVRVYPVTVTITELQRRMQSLLGKGISRTAVAFHVRKLKESSLVELNGSGEGFRAVKTVLTIEFDHNGLRVERGRKK